MSDETETPPKPERISYNVWQAIDASARTIPTLHAIDGDYPVITSRDAQEDLRRAKQSIETAIERLEEVEQYHDE